MLALSLAGLGCTPSPEARPPLGISNGTTLAVTLLVNGQVVAGYPPGGGDSDVDVSRLPPLPWDVVVRTATGRVLTSMRVEPGQVSRTVDPAGVISTSGALGRVDLSCGRLDLWAGYDRPIGPAPGPSVGAPGDCDP